jgi:hypothetical protein
MKKTMDHIAYAKSLKSKSDAALRYIAKDAQEAINAMPEGENADYYADEINYVAMELHQRKNK